MQILPAIDIKEGQAVRLFKGDFSQKTVVNPDVLGQAKIFAQAGIKFIHVVDLDGTLNGRATNRGSIAKLKQESGPDVKVGDGIHALEQAGNYLTADIDRVIIGSVVMKNPDFVKAALNKSGSDKIVIGIDTKNGFMTAEGWLETSSVDYISLAKTMERIEIILLVYIDADHDDTLAGPNFEHYKRLVAELAIAKVVAFGGIVGKNDLVKLQEIGVAGTIVGKAYYSGDINLGGLKVFGG